MADIFSSNSLQTVAELIQLSIAPVFLLAGVAGFLNVFTGRLTRIIDRLERLNLYEEDRTNIETKADKKLIELRHSSLMKRMRNTNLAILLMSSTGFFTALLMITMFVSAAFDLQDAYLVSFLFIASMVSLILALLLFLREILYTSVYISYKKGDIP